MDYCIYCMEPLQNGVCPHHCTPPPEEEPHILPPGTVLNDRYLVGQSLGQGGFGITYIGRDRLLDIRVAIKEYYPTGFVTRAARVSPAVTATGQAKRDLLAREIEKFLAEAKTLAKFINERGIVEVRDYFRANNTAYIVMEYLEGETLRDYIHRTGPLPIAQALALLTPVMRSLDKVHRAGLIHRDISPDNIMLLANGEVKLLDFGTARAASPYGEQSLSVMLKPGYAPEEQYRSKGSQGPWTDIYALCATLYKCVTGITPIDSLDRLHEDTVVPPSRLGIILAPAQEQAIMTGMACRSADRFQSIPALAAALGLTGFPPAAREAAQPTVLMTERPGAAAREAPPVREASAVRETSAGASSVRETSSAQEASSAGDAGGPAKPRQRPRRVLYGGVLAAVLAVFLLSKTFQNRPYTFMDSPWEKYLTGAVMSVPAHNGTLPSADDIVPENPTLSKASELGLLTYSSITDYSAPLTRLGASELLVETSEVLIFYANATGEVDCPYSDCASLTERQQKIIAGIASCGILSGVSSDQFLPYDSVTRGTMAELLWQATGFPEPDRTLCPPDAADGWYADAVAWLAGTGAVSPTADFHPGELITGEEAVAWMVALRS